MNKHADSPALAPIGSIAFDDYIEMARKFHGYPAPGLIVGGYMVEMARRHIPEGVLFDAISEASSCLPDAVQMLTPCTAGNGWLRVVDLGRYALSLFNKHTGEGVRVFLDVSKLDAYPEYLAWYMKKKTKQEQDSDLLREEMGRAGESVLTLAPVQIKPEHVGKSSKGPIAVCPLCSEAYPRAHGGICKGCQGQTPILETATPELTPEPELKTVDVEDAVGKRVLHDMTRIVPGESKGAEFVRGQELTAGDVCRLQLMGRNRVHIMDDVDGPDSEWVHENTVAEAFVAQMCNERPLSVEGPPREGKINIQADVDGLFTVNESLLETFNLVPGVMCASMHGNSVVKKGQRLAGTRAIPLYLPRAEFEKAMTILEEGSPFNVLPLRKAKVGLLVTGTEVFNGLVKDRFEPTLQPKIEALGSELVKTLIRPDDAEQIRDAARELLDFGCDLIITTAGLSVDPDDVTRKGLVDAGAESLLYGMPVLPGAMTLIGKLGGADLVGVPACALFFATTSFDLLVPRILAGQEITRKDLAKLGHGALCKECPECSYPHCPFGK